MFLSRREKRNRRCFQTHRDATQTPRYDNKEVEATTLARLITDC